ncbi:ArsR/SmtB family transcription factor [Haloferula sargassicola]
MNPSDVPQPAPGVSRRLVAKALGHERRWRLLAELSRGEGLMVVELSERVGISQNTISKHMRTLRDAGMVVVNRAGMYSIPAPCLISTEEGTVDYGHCVLRLRPKTTG